MTDHAATLDMLAARAAIHDLVMAYCRGVDRADAALLASIFWDDATMISGPVNGPAHKFAQDITAYCRNTMDHCFHAVANQWVEVQGDKAIGEHYVTAQVRADGQDMLTGGRYLDRYERRDGVWKIAHRCFVADWTMSQPAGAPLDTSYEPGRTRGGWGDADPVYAHWASL
ncbi:nuclear transport factor 2 family protein [Sphingobium abikonense]|uniref:nuclear transport factor 2 family protein n=1 Tax=Sphingobium abikonense TaxID=86193 RepID=UPI003511B2DA